MKKLSLKLRLIILFVLIAGVFGVIAGALSWVETREKIDEFFDTYQIALARQLAAADWKFASPLSQKQTNKQLKHIAHANDEDEAIGFAVFTKDGKKVFHDDENGKDFSYTPVIGSYVEQIVDGEKWRIVWVYSADNQFVIAVGQELEYREDIAWDMAEEFITPWAIGLALLLIVMILVIAVELSPLAKLAKEVGARKEGDLSPIPETKLPKEILPLIRAMNSLLKQTEQMLNRERSFISDSAHELRTPLSALKVQLEVLEMSVNDEKERTKALQKMEQGISRCSRLVEQLLALSKIDTTSAAQLNEDHIIDWNKLVSQILEDYSEKIKEKSLQIDLDLGNSAPFEKGNSVLAALMLRNLVDNAVKYSPKEAVIRIDMNNQMLKVTNSKTTVEEKNLALLGQRFFRPAGQKETGSGLGLSIVRKIAEFYDCDVAFSNTEDGFCVTITK